MTLPENTRADTPSTEELSRLISTFSEGALQESETLARFLAERYPGAPLAWKVLGATKYLSGELSAAIIPMRRSANAAPHDAEAQFNLGVALFDLRLFEEASLAYKAAIRARPGYPEAHNNLGNLLRHLGKLDASQAAYREALRSRPEYALAQGNLAKCLRDSGNLEASIRAYHSAICIQPEYPDAYSNFGVTLKDLGLQADAATQFRRAIQLGPSLSEARNNLGIALFDSGQFKLATSTYQSALILRPEYPEALNNLGNSQRQEGNVIRGAQLFQRALRLHPLYPEALNNLGIILYDRRLYKRSISSYQSALVSRPDYAEAYSNLGISHYTDGTIDAAEACLKRALCIRPGYAEALSNLGATLREQGQLSEAEVAYEEAIQLRPDYPEAHWNNALLQLLQGHYEKGWRSYEWRFRNRELDNPAKISLKDSWSGESPLKGRTILLYAEQGLGDTIQFYRYARLIRDRGAQIILEVQPELHELFAAQKDPFTIIPRGKAPPDHDLVYPLMSLPLALNTTLETIPDPTPYLQPDSQALKKWEALLGNKSRLRIGLVASGSQNHTEDRKRSINWHRLAPLFQLPCEFFCLQKDLREDDAGFLSGQPEVRNLSRAMSTFNDTAAIASLMDLVISVDTSIAHLSAALGTETWILIPQIPDWRWLLNRKDSPWYSAVRLIRQEHRGNWEQVILDVRMKLQDRLSSRQPVAQEP